MKKHLNISILVVLLGAAMYSCNEPENTPIENAFAPLRELTVPGYYQMVQGQSIEIEGRGFSVLDSAVLKPVLGGLDYRPTKVAAGAYGYSLTIPRNIPVGDYNIVIYRYDGQVADLGKVSIHSEVAIDELEGDLRTSLGGGVQLLSSEKGKSQFCAGDSIMLIDKSNSQVFKVPASVDQRSTYKLSYQAPEDYLGEARTYLIRGATVSYLQDLETLDIKVGDYYEGGVIIWFNPEKALSGICVNIFNGVTKERGYDGTWKRLPVGNEYFSGDKNGTETIAAQAIGMGDVNTKKFYDFEVKRGKNPGAIQHRDYNGTNALQSIAYAAMNYSLVGLDGETYDDWFLPAFQTMRILLYNIEKYNAIFDELGGEPLPGSKWVYKTDPYKGQNCWGYGDGMSTATSNVDNREEYYYNARLVVFRPTIAEEEGGEFVEDDHLSSYMIQAPDFAFRLVRKFGYEK